MLDVLNLIGDPEFKYDTIYGSSPKGKNRQTHEPIQAMLRTVLGASWCSFMDHLHFGRPEVKNLFYIINSREKAHLIYYDTLI